MHIQSYFSEARIPDIESCDVSVYLLLWCCWSPERRSRYKQDNGYRLYMACHMVMSRLPGLPVHVPTSINLHARDTPECSTL